LTTVEAGAHLPLIDFAGEGVSGERLFATVDAARECGFAAVSANDHFVFQRPWLDGFVALAATVERSGDRQLATTIALANLRGPVAVAKALDALDILSEGRLVAGVGPGSSRADYDLVGAPFEDRWKLFDDAVVRIRERLERPVPLWIGSWGSPAGLRRVARLGDGWLASSYNTTPERFAASLDALGHDTPHALVTMWTWVTDSRADADRVLSTTLAPMLRRDPAELQLCVGSPEACAELLSRYAQAGCRRVHFWPLGDERRQIERLTSEVLPHVAP
jgi:alkanesulfonate monooxygenase SsuD/methylene tetrahydromethanopterin reductase-like flavin-dependent oxidoreductase (luciferase family)